MTLPTHARAVIVGAGIVGCSVAYHLARLGWKDILMVDRLKIGGGTSFHAAGLVGQLRSSAAITQLLGHSVALYQRLEAETGQATGWKMSGGLRLAATPGRLLELQRQATTARSFGLDMHMLTPSEVKALWPLMEVKDLVGGAFTPSDGQASPLDITQALAQGARTAGVDIREGVRVTGVMVENGRAAGIRTAKGDVRAEVVINCAGQWARALGRMAGVNVPLVSMQHQYLITEPMEGVSPDLPTVRDPDAGTYFKEEVGGLVMGGYEPDPLPFDPLKGPVRAFRLLEPKWGQFQQLSDLATRRVPALETAGIRQLVCGPESFTPDGYFILGEAPELSGFFVAAGFNSFGIASAGGAGKALAEWVDSGEPQSDLWAVDIRRFGTHHRDLRWLRARTSEAYGKHYALPWDAERTSGRPLRRSALYDRLRAAGACFGEKLGWERPEWFAPGGVAPVEAPTPGRGAAFEYVGAEHRAVREAAGLFDQSSFAKFLVLGRDAARALEWICANRIDHPPGRLVYTQMLNSRGGIECDLTVARLAEDRFYLVTGTGFATHDAHWIRSHFPAGADVQLVDLGSAHSVLSLFGPRARDILAPLCEEDIGNTAFPFGQVRSLSVAGAPVTALRVTYVGELGWELHLPAEFAQGVFEALMEAGAPHGLRLCGYRAIESLRLEKGYRAWGHELSSTTTPLEAGLGWAVKLRGGQPFLGREALQAQAAGALRRRLAAVTAAPEVMLHGRETLYRDGERVGYLSSGGYGYTLERSIGYAYLGRADASEAGVDAAWIDSGHYELEVAGERVPAQVHTGVLYDPGMERVKC